MSEKNTGIQIFADKPLGGDKPAMFCVLGLPGGGTTMTSRLLEAAGVFMGENLNYNAEDPQFAALLKEEAPDEDSFFSLVEQRNSQYTRWGFKAPFRFHWDLLAKLVNVRFVCVFRDVFVVANRNVIAAGADPFRAMRANMGVQRKIVDFLASTDSPHLMFSYEKALLDPAEIATQVLQFTGNPESDEVLANMVSVVEPSEATYVARRAGSR